MIQLRSYELAIELYKDIKGLKLPAVLQEQAERACSSVALNLAEGYGRTSKKDRERLFTIAMGSVRELQAVSDLEVAKFEKLKRKLDHLAASIWKLTH